MAATRTGDDEVADPAGGDTTSLAAGSGTSNFAAMAPSAA